MRSSISASRTSTAGARALLATADPLLLEDLLRLCAAVGVEAEVAGHPQACLGAWLRASMILVGADMAGSIIAVSPRRRSDVVVVSRAEAEAPLWQRAVELGAEQVVVLPEGEPWLVGRIAEAVAGDGRRGHIIAVTGSRGGAGATTMATAVAFAALRTGSSSALVDFDPWGGGLDLVLALEDQLGARWPDLANTTGRLSAAAITDALPRRDGLAVLSWDRSPVTEVPSAATASALEGLARAFEVVVADVPRASAPHAAEVLGEVSATVLVVPREIRAVAAAHRLVSPLAAGAPVLLVTRGPGSSGLDPERVAQTLELPLLADVRTESRIAAAAERGEPPGPRSSLSRAAHAVLAAGLAPAVAA